MQEELRRLAHRADEEEEGQKFQRCEFITNEGHGRIGLPFDAVEDRRKVDAVEDEEDAEDTEREAEIADAVDHKGLDRGGVSRRFVMPEPDQKVRGDADALPPKEHLEEVV